MTYSPTVRRRRLSMLLRQYRENVGMDMVVAAKQLGWDPSKVSRMERGAWKRPNTRDVSDLLTLYGVTDPDVLDAARQLAADSRHRGWWADYSDVFRGSLPDFEAGASAIRTYEALLIPGLLQTPGYARAIFGAGQILAEADVQRRVSARMARQKILNRDNAPQMWAVVDEAALTKLVGGAEVMREQLLHLVEMAREPNMTVQVIRASAGAHPAMSGGAFTILDFPAPDDLSLVYLETATDSLYLERSEELRTYTLFYYHVLAAALSVDESLQYIATLVDQLT